MKYFLPFIIIAMHNFYLVNADVRGICADASKSTNFKFSTIIAPLQAIKNKVKNLVKNSRFIPALTRSRSNFFVNLASIIAAKKLNQVRNHSKAIKLTKINRYNALLSANALQNIPTSPEQSKKNPGIVPITLNDTRPAQVQAAIHEAFEQIKENKCWLYNGKWGFYGLLELAEEAMLDKLISENSGKKDIYILDVGCAKGEWGKYAMSTLLENAACKKSGKQFHIFSVTGGKECKELVQKTDNVTLYQLNQFSIENIEEEFSRRGFDLNNKVDLIVSSWTLRHLVDPFGTLKRMYGLLTPDQGMLMSNGFLFMVNDSGTVKAFPAESENILMNANATVLFRDLTAGRDTGQFLLVRNDKNSLNIPLDYEGNVHFIGPRYQNASQMVTVFNKGSFNEPTFEREYIKESRWGHYCHKDDQQCKKLYTLLKRLGLFLEDNKS